MRSSKILPIVSIVKQELGNQGLEELKRKQKELNETAAFEKKKVDDPTSLNDLKPERVIAKKTLKHEKEGMKETTIVRKEKKKAKVNLKLKARRVKKKGSEEEEMIVVNKKDFEAYIKQ